MNKNQKGTVPIIAIVLLAVAIGGAAYVGQKYFAPKPTPLPTTKPPLEVNFSETGNILNWDSQTESYTDEWTLLYEKPGNPAIPVKLKFDENSLCNLGEEEKPCDKSKLNNGDRATVEGNKVDDTVTVIKLEKLNTAL